MTTAPQRILLLPDSRPREDLTSAPKVRRYRLARLRVAESRHPTEPRFAPLTRAYD